jgi:hypothetical protein
VGLMMLKIEHYKIKAPMDLLAPHTSGPRDVPRCGALSLLQKTPHYRGSAKLLLG